ncbi:hypothetical protein [Pantoea sp. A4]|uniref:hypothetical protein n=1 Tax=Pantoea sp. A4 TaxID=1225184 RepID=UPI00035D1C37|nr:hypothetical protein [Pantoea sp. A4]
MSQSEQVKSKTDYLRDVTSQVKEMQHYAQTNTEKLSSAWLAFDAGEYKDKTFAPRFETLIDQQGKLLDEFNTVIQDIEIAINHSEQEK